MNDFFQMSDIFMFQLPRKIIFGNGAIKKIGEEATAMFPGQNGAFLITDKGVHGAGLTDEATASLKKSGFEVIVFDEVTPDPPFTLVNKCLALARKEKIGVILRNRRREFHRYRQNCLMYGPIPGWHRRIPRHQ